MLHIVFLMQYRIIHTHQTYLGVTATFVDYYIAMAIGIPNTVNDRKTMATAVGTVGMRCIGMINITVYLHAWSLSVPHKKIVYYLAQ